MTDQIFTSDQLEGMRETQESHMMDTCVIQRYSRTISSFGEPVETYTDQSAIHCGLEQQAGNEAHQTNMNMVVYDAVVRLPIDVILDPKDHLKITKRFDETVTALIYEVAAPIQRGASGVRVRLKLVQV